MPVKLRQSRVVHITTDLEGAINRELLSLEDRLKLPSMDDRPFTCNMLAARVHALQWVLEQSRADL